MSILDLIREQQLIILSVGLAALPLLIAAGLFLLPRLRQMRARRAQRKAEQAELRAQEQAELRTHRRERKSRQSQEEDDLFVPPAEPRPATGSRAQYQQQAAEYSSANDTASGQVSNAAVAHQTSPQPTAARPGEAQPGEAHVDEGEQTEPSAEGEQQAQADQSDKPSAEMQDILSSVFADDEALAMYAALLEGTDDIDITHLAELSDQIAGQLHQRSESAVLG